MLLERKLVTASYKPLSESNVPRPEL